MNRVKRASTAAERVDDEALDPLLLLLLLVLSEEGEGDGTDFDVVAGRLLFVDGTRVVVVTGVERKVAVGPSPVFVLVSVGGTLEDGAWHLGALEESRKHWYPGGQQKFSPVQTT